MTTYGTLFSGGGVADCGFTAAGMVGRWAVEFDPKIASVFRLNHDHPVHVSPVEEINPRTLEPVDYLHASPSCKNASVANTKGGEAAGDIDAARGVCEFIKVMRPQTFTLENVWQYRTFHSFKMIVEVLESLGYFVSWAHLCSADAGVAQTRRRLILRATLGRLVPTLPTPTPWRGWYEVIEDLIPTLPESAFAPWQIARMGDDVRSMLMDGQTNSDGQTITVPEPDEPCFTIGATISKRPMRAILVSGTDALVRQSAQPSITVTATQGKGTIATRAFIVEAKQNNPRAFIIDGRNSRTTNDEPATIRDSGDPCFTITAADGVARHRAFVTDRSASQQEMFGEVGRSHLSWLECGRVVRMTTRAIARFQSIPDTYQLTGNTGLDCTVIGNGFSSLWAESIARGLIE